MMNYFTELLSDYTVQTIVMGAAVLGMFSGLLGTWAVVRRQSLLGDAVAHAALPGIALAFLIIGTKNTFYLLTGAALAGWLAVLWIRGITINTRIKYDTALAIALATFFGFGMVLITFIQRMPNAQQGGLEAFLFGQAATLLRSDVITMAIIAGVATLILLLFWKEFKIISFDPQFAHASGFNIKAPDILLNTLIVVAIVLGLQAVGVVLMSALIIAPAAAARQWTNKLWVMSLLAAIIGAMSGVIGSALSGSFTKLPTGPLIVLTSIVFVAVSFLFAPHRGLVAVFVQRLKNKKRVALDTLLMQLYGISGTHSNMQHPHSLSILKPLPSFNRNTIKLLSDKNLIKITDSKEWSLTDEGIRRAQKLIETGG